MTLTVKHKFLNEIPDDPDDAAAGATLPSHWNDEHQIVEAGINAVFETDAQGRVSTITKANGLVVTIGYNNSNITVTRSGNTAGHETLIKTLNFAGNGNIANTEHT